MPGYNITTKAVNSTTVGYNDFKKMFRKQMIIQIYSPLSVHWP